MYKVFLNIAGFKLGIRFNKTELPFAKERLYRNHIYDLYRGFVTEEEVKKPDFWIDIIHTSSIEVISDKKRGKNFVHFYKHLNKKRIVTFYHLSDTQLELILRKVLQILLAKSKGLLIHASASLVGDKAYLFLGQSGAGKSTIIKLLSSNYPSLGDDSAIIKYKEDNYYFYQTPFKEKSEWIYRSGIKFPIEKILFLRKSQNFKIDKIKNKEIIAKKLMQQITIDRDELDGQLKIIAKFIDKFNDFYYLDFSDNSDKLIKLVKESSISIKNRWINIH